MAVLNNLNKYIDHLNYYKLYTDNNIKLNEIIQNIIKTYKFDYIKYKNQTKKLYLGLNLLKLIRLLKFTSNKFYFVVSFMT